MDSNFLYGVIVSVLHLTQRPYNLTKSCHGLSILLCMSASLDLSLLVGMLVERESTLQSTCCLVWV